MAADESKTTIQTYRTESCFSCRMKKRKCDKQLPACSRCKRADQQCLYGSAVHGVYGAIVPITNREQTEISLRSVHSSPDLTPQSLANATRKSCRRCMKQKMLCDKVYPCCARCKSYEQLDRLRLLSSQHLFYPDFAGKSVQTKPSYPVESKPYFPALIKYFQDRMGLSALQVDIGSLAYHLRSSWVQNALTDPCLFHATLYAASAQLDTIRETSPNSNTSTNCVTLYHQAKTINILNSRIASGGEMDDVTIAAVLMLVISGSLQNDNQAAEVHMLGLLRMVALRGGMVKLGFNGFLAQMIKMNMVLPAVVFDRLGVFHIEGTSHPAAVRNLPDLTLQRLEASTTGNGRIRSYMTATFQHVQGLLLAVGGEDEIGEPGYDFVAVRDMIDHVAPWNNPLPENISSGEDAMVRSCLWSVSILRYLLDDRLPLQTHKLVAMVVEMKSHVSRSDPTTWLKYAPHANLWVILLGMAVSEDVQGRLWFLMNEKCVVMSIKDSTPAIPENVWSCYCWMRRLMHARFALWTASDYDANELFSI